MRILTIVIRLSCISIPFQMFVSTLYHYKRICKLDDGSRRCRRTIHLILLGAFLNVLSEIGHIALLCNTESGSNPITTTTTTAAAIAIATGPRTLLLPTADVEIWILSWIALLSLVCIVCSVHSLVRFVCEIGEKNATLYEQTNETERKLETFRSFLCHEIRNPLFVMTSTIEFFDEESAGNGGRACNTKRISSKDGATSLSSPTLTSLTSNQKMALRSIWNSANLMLRIVNDVLDLKKLEDGKFSIEQKPYNFRELLRNIASSSRIQIRQKSESSVSSLYDSAIQQQPQQQQQPGEATPQEMARNPIRFRFQISKDVPNVVLGDSIRLLQIMCNLLSNACKFTNEGEVNFKVSVVEYDRAVQKNLVLACHADGATATSCRNSNKDKTSGTNSRNELDYCPYGPAIQLDTSSLHRSILNVRLTTPHATALWKSNQLEQKLAYPLLNQSDSDESDRGDVSDDDRNIIVTPKGCGKKQSIASASSSRYGYTTKKTEHSPANSITSTCSENGVVVKVLRIEVSDTGVGMTREQIQQILEPYSHKKLSDYRIHGGTGLGLTIISRLVQIMNGTLHVSSVLGKGTTFIVYLPIFVPTAQNEICVDPCLSSESTVRKSVKSSLLPEMMVQSLADPTSNKMTNISLQLKECDSVERIQSRNSPIKTASICTNTSTNLSTNNEIPFKKSITALTQQCVTVDEQPDLIVRNSFSRGTMEEASSLLLDTASSSEEHQLPQQQHYDVVSSITTSDTSCYNSNQEIQQKFVFQSKSAVVLVVDDNEINRKLLCRMLHHFNLEYDTACNGKEAVEKILQSRCVTGNVDDPYYALIWMDLQMPVMDGCEAMHILRHTYELRTLPIIALTANALDNSREEAYKAGATDFCTKPILRDAMYYKCCQYLMQISQAGTTTDTCDDESNTITNVSSTAI